MPKPSTNPKNLKEQLAGLSREQLLKLLSELLDDAPEIGEWLAAAMPVSDFADQSKTAPSKSAQRKPAQPVDAKV
ncbi:MAG TPA: hypothetical protein PLD20_15515 [Blastocatellia bacterium]|nr:hypothetical protein [Blastocatellia bacterium]HMV87580.1 hypothetical protein [Blastocatellia bacterium]HMX28301.1 hypothetical protein [Blastocatellia bacterium]HMY75287.1 hypothetical protein [Blastocatellia bacterium]HMZ19344.1 hypothetical protein [Blastocatellia bacterium]